MLFLVQDSDRPMYVEADDMNEAVRIWRQRIQEENSYDDCSDECPRGVQLLESDEDSILLKSPTTEIMFWRVIVPNYDQQKTGKEWMKLFGIRVIDPDGWRRKRIDYDEKISFIVFIECVRGSSCVQQTNGSVGEEGTGV